MDFTIRVENLSKVFYNKKEKKLSKDQREIWALNGVSFNVNKGEVFGLLGPNGAGKTTAIRCIAGLLTPAAGEIFINNQELNSMIVPKLREKMGFLTENHGNYENLSVFENLNFFGSFYKIKDLNKRIEFVLEQMDLLKRKDMKAGKLSKGQKQRLAIARAILHDPEIVFFDEPTAGLDPVAAVKVRNLILGLKNQTRTIFINSHNLEEVQKVCDRVAILDLGRIKRIGAPSELSKELWETQEMVCTLKNPIPDDFKANLIKLDFIKQFKIENNKIYFYTTDVNETTPIIVKELVKLGADVLEVSRTVHSLEDIYLKLMDDKNINN